jgi:hypothetical protein
MPVPQGATVELRPLTAAEAKSLRRLKPAFCFGTWAMTTGLFGLIAVAIISVPVGAIWLIGLLVRLILGKSVSDHLSNLQPWGWVLIAVVVAIGVFTGVGILVDEWKRRWLRRSELKRGTARTTCGRADLAWFQLIHYPDDHVLIFRVAPDELLVVNNALDSKAPEPTQIGRDIRLSQLPRSGALISFEASGDPIPVRTLPDEMVSFSHGPIEGVVPVDRATPEFRALVES